MKMKILLFLFLALTANTASAAQTWYVRTADGGTISQCNGHTDHALAGATGTACAVKDLHEIIAHVYDDTNTTGTTLIAGGDTIIIDGTVENGYEPTNIWSSCSSSYPYGCILAPIPGGPDASHKTKIYGRGYDTGCTGTKAQIWGNERTRKVLTIQSHTDIQCLDITDHSNCIESGPSAGTQGGDPVQCQRDTYPYGHWAQYGIYSDGATDVSLTNVDVHGLAHTDMYILHAGDWTITTSNLGAAGWATWDSDGSAPDDSYSGTITFDRSNLAWGGCGEKYPLTTTDLMSPSNIHHCWSQDQGGYGDIIGLGDGNPGNWVFKNSRVGPGASDCIDLLHGQGTGSITIDRTYVSGCAGQQIKTNATTVFIDNSAVIGNCNYFAGQAFTSTKSVSGANVGFNNCRAQGTTVEISQSIGGQVARINNSTIVGNGDELIGSAGSGCNNATKIYAYNNIFLGGNDVNGGDLSDLYYAAGQSGNGDGSCGTLALTEDYNQIYGLKNGAGNSAITGTHSRYGSPLLTGQSSLLMNTSPYYQGSSGLSLLPLGASSPSRYSVTGANSADETVTLSSNGSSDFYSVSRGSNWDGGAFQYGACVATNGFCSITADCCAGTCSGGVCTSGSTCGNNIKEPGETCDGTDLNSQTCPTQGYASGTLSCAGNCSSFVTSSCVASPICGNGVKEAGEVCDGADLNSKTCPTQGFSSGTLSCAGNCQSFVTSSCVNTPVCGNNMKETGETCDGTDLNNQSCPSQGFATGTLACAGNCLSYVTSGCANYTVDYQLSGKVIISGKTH